ncbi:MAG: glycosyltransferase family 4 protein [Candidatus Methanofastidiosia archaeon]|jgi:glycosyltransferase involved in cell wall biosynthesis
MRVCHIRFTHYFDQGNISLYGYTKALSDLEYETHVIVAKRKKEPQEEKINNVHIHRVPLSFSSGKNLRSPFFFLAAVKTLKKLEHRKKFHIVHVYVCPGSFLVPLLGPSSAEYILDVRSGGIRGKIWNFLVKTIIKLESLFFKNTIVLTEGIAHYLLGKKDVFIVPLGTDFEIFTSQPKTQLRKSFNITQDIVFVYVGNMYKERNVRTVVSAFNKVNTKFKNTALIMVGDGPDLKNVKALTKECNIDQNVIFTGYVQYEKIPDIINAADIGISFVPIVKKYYYQPPLKTVEYLACEIPTIATDTAGNRVFIQDGYNGILIDDTADALTDAMCRLIEDDDLRETLKKKARNSVAEFDWKTIVKNKLIPVYEECLKN